MGSAETQGNYWGHVGFGKRSYNGKSMASKVIVKQGRAGQGKKKSRGNDEMMRD